ncbi:MAG: HlyD family efflux transporter periplasmic adaptor subunit [Mogibacterium sp.]|nr:HlyD family efflux transporter periplasmic adaptor subunit [Mogibacterium sp.]
MNKKHIVTFEELRDSKLLYEKDMPAFGYLFLMLIFVLLIAVSVWGTKTTKPYIVKGSGIVESPNKNYVMTPFTGEITGIAIEEGDYVNKGDRLFSVKSTDTDVQGRQIDNQKQIYEKGIRQYNKLVKSIKDDRNYFSASDTDDSLYYSRFEEYKSQIKQQTVDVKAYKDYGYTDKQIKDEIAKNEAKKSEIYYSAIREAETAREQLQTELNALNAQSDALSRGAEDYIVKASASGTIHMMSDYKDGMVVQTASPVASISTENDEFYITASVAASDRSRIKEGNKADIEVSGLQQNIYGTIKGKVESIDSDVSTTEDGKAFFKVKVEPEKYYLMNKEGNKINLSAGLQTEIRISYEEITYAKYLLDALGLKD